MSLGTIALELVPPNLDRGAEAAVDEGRKVNRLLAQSGLDRLVRHVMLPGMIVEDDDRPIRMQPKFDVLDFWSLITPQLPGVRGLCTQVTSFMDSPALDLRVAQLCAAGFDGIAFVGVPRTMNDGDGEGVAPTDALRAYGSVVPNRGAILIPTRTGEQGRFAFKCDQGATYGMTQLLYSDAIVEFLAELARTSDHRPEILLSFGFVPQVEARVGLIEWLIKDPGNPRVADEQAFVRRLAEAEPAVKRRLMIDLYKRVVEGVAGLGFPLSVHLEATYGPSAPAFDTFAEMLDHWSPSDPRPGPHRA